MFQFSPWLTSFLLFLSSLSLFLCVRVCVCVRACVWCVRMLCCVCARVCGACVVWCVCVVCVHVDMEKYEVSDSDDEDLPFACYLCREVFNTPVVTKYALYKL